VYDWNWIMRTEKKGRILKIRTGYKMNGRIMKIRTVYVGRRRKEEL